MQPLLSYEVVQNTQSKPTFCNLKSEAINSDDKWLTFGLILFHRNSRVYLTPQQLPPLLSYEFYMIPFAIIVGICFILMAMFMVSVPPRPYSIVITVYNLYNYLCMLIFLLYFHHSFWIKKCFKLGVMQRGQL